MLALILAMGIVPAALVSATNGGGGAVIGNWGFIPNSGEASVSKVDLETGTAIARYWTAPRLGDAGNTIPPYAWRTSRIAMGADGSAWVLNVGSDAYLNDYPNDPVNYGAGYDTYVPANGLVGSVVRVEGDVEAAGLTPGDNTSDNHTTPMAFGNDLAVQVFPVGNLGDMPRAIAIDANGDVWIGFYGGKYFQKYAYDGSSLTPVGDNITGDFSPYQALIDKDGILWFSSRNSNPSVGATPGIYYFDTQSPGPPTRIDLGENPYSILVDNSGEDVVVWATSYSSNLHKIEGNSLNMTVAITGASQLRGMSFDGTGIIWIANTSDHTVCWYDPGSDTSGESGIIASGAYPVGVGMDAAGYMWAVCRDDGSPEGFIAKFDPMNVGGGFTPTDVGYRPYAYGDFTEAAPPTYNICGVKYADWEGEEIPLPGWTITLEKDVEGSWEIVASVETDENGAYCFTDLEAGDYRVSETLKDGWDQVSPGGGYHHITLPDGEDPELSYDFHNTPTEYCFDETAWAADGAPAITRFVTPPGNWATYVDYTVGAASDEAGAMVYPLYAGQTYYAGDLLVWDDGDNLYVKYVASGEDDGYGAKEGYCGGNWTGLTEYHLQVVDEFDDFNAYRVYNKKKMEYGAPIPGSFDDIWEGEKVAETDPPIAVDISDLNDPIVIAAHAVMWWCGYDCDALDEIEAALNGD
jgi:hypothetical protein